MQYNIVECGKRIQTLRIKMSMSQVALAAALNIHAASLCAIERGRRPASIDLLIDVAELFDVSLDYLILGKDCSADAYLYAETQEALAHLMEVARILGISKP